MAIKKNIELFRGTTTSFILSVEPVELTENDTIRLTIKPVYDNDLTDAAAYVIKDVSGPIDATDGTLTIHVLPEDTIGIEPGKYVYDLTATLGGNDRTVLLYGKVKINAVATLRGVR